MRRALTLVCLLIVSAFVFPQEKSAITHESMWLMKRVGAPALSPDGKYVVFSVQEPAYDEKNQVNDLWIAPADGSKPPRRLTAAKTGESAYTWSPDGALIAFVAKREGDEAPQIYLLNLLEGGEAQPFTRLSTGAGAPLFSPDGQSILFTSSVYPLCFTDSLSKKKAQEIKDRKYSARVYESFPIRYFDRWLDGRQTHLYVQKLAPGSEPRNLFAEATISQAEGFGLSGPAAWSPDGSSVIFSATTEANTSAYSQPAYALYKVAVNGGDALPLTEPSFSYREPAFDPTGKYLLCTGSPSQTYTVYEQGNLFRFDWPAVSNRLNLSAQLDRPINGYTIYQQTLYLSVQNEGRDVLMTLSLNGGAPKSFGNASSGCLHSLSGARSTVAMAAISESENHPAEVVRVLPNGAIQPISAFNSEAIAQLDLPAPETFWFTSSRGKRIRSMLVRPAGFDPAKKYPLFVVMHGGPAGSWKENWGYRWNYHLLAAPGYVVLLTDYTGSTGYGEKFSQDIQYDPFKGPAEEINEAAAEAIQRYGFIDAERQAAGGASYGGHLAYWMAATTTHYKCLIAHAGAVNLVSQWGISDVIYGREIMNGGAPWTQTETWKTQNPYLYAGQFQTPMLITVGEKDYRVPYNNSIEAWHILQRRQIPGKLLIFPDENHWILKAENSRFFYSEVHSWLKKYLE